MSINPTKISWATHTWNPITGCSPCSPGCANCYAKDLHNKRHKAYLEGKKVPACYAKPFNEITFFQERLDEPARLRKPATIFVCSMGDLFHPDVKDKWIDSVFAAIALCPQHTFMILTKRPDRMQQYLICKYATEGIESAICSLMGQMPRLDEPAKTWPLPNVWLGVTVCNQAEADEKIPILLQTPAAHRFVSIEPMLSGVKIPRYFLGKAAVCCCGEREPEFEMHGTTCPECGRNRPVQNGIDFVIVGGETGKNARPMRPDWVRSIRDQCSAAGVPFHFKSWGEHVELNVPLHGPVIDQNGREHTRGKDKKRETWLIHGNEVICVRVGSKRAGHLLDGVEHRAMPGEKA